MSKEFSEKLRNEQKARLTKRDGADVLLDVRCVKVHVGTAVIICRRVSDGYDLEVLMGLRCGKHGPGTWSLPGGWMEHGEEPEETAKREVLEETGIVVTDIQPYHVPYTNTVFGDGVQSLTLFFVSTGWAGTPRVLEPDKCKEWRWFDVNDLPTPLFDPLLRASIPEALRLDWARGNL